TRLPNRPYSRNSERREAPGDFCSSFILLRCKAACRPVLHRAERPEVRGPSGRNGCRDRPPEAAGRGVISCNVNFRADRLGAIVPCRRGRVHCAPRAGACSGTLSTPGRRLRRRLSIRRPFDRPRTTKETTKGRRHDRHAANAAGAPYRLLPERARHGWRARSLQDEFTAVRQEAIWRTRGTGTPNDREKTPRSCQIESRDCETEPTEGRKNPSAEVR